MDYNLCHSFNLLKAFRYGTPLTVMLKVFSTLAKEALSSRLHFLTISPKFSMFDNFCVIFDVELLISPVICFLQKITVLISYLANTVASSKASVRRHLWLKHTDSSRYEGYIFSYFVFTIFLFVPINKQNGNIIINYPVTFKMSKITQP